MKNYYEILEINEKASQEIIDKVYKVLIKKYHPDLQENSEIKTKYEEKIKEINEAYEILSNPEKRNEYDKMLLQEKELASKKTYEQQQTYTKPNTASTYNSPPPSNNTTNTTVENKAQRNYEEEVINAEKQNAQYQEAINKAYHDAYVQDLKNRGYKIKYKKTWNERLRSLIAIFLTFGVLILIWQIPFVQNYFKDLYATNEIFRNIVDVFLNIFR